MAETKDRKVIEQYEKREITRNALCISVGIFPGLFPFSSPGTFALV